MDRNFLSLLRTAMWVVLALALCLPSAAQSLRAAAASDLQFVLPELAGQYERQSGQELAISFGSSGNFFAQIQNGAPFDLFFSADISYPEKLIRAGLAEGDTLQTYAAGRIVLWVPSDSPLDPGKLGWKVLLDPGVQRIAIANPAHAPYGRAAVAALQKAELYERLQPKLVLGENIAQTAQFVQSGGAQAGILALSLALSPPLKTGKRWDIPPELYPPIRQGVVVLKSSPSQAEARAFLAFLRSEPARVTLARHGFSLPQAEAQRKP